MPPADAAPLNDPTKAAVAGTDSFSAALTPDNTTGNGLSLTGPPLGDMPLPAPAPWPKAPGYDIFAELGRGGMGVVYRARQVGLNQDVALKMILAGSWADPAAKARFRAEAAAVARLQHPNIVQIFDIGEVQGQPFFSLEFVEGGNLDERLAQQPPSPTQSAELVATLWYQFQITNNDSGVAECVLRLKIQLSTRPSE